MNQLDIFASRFTTVFHNTTELKGEELEKAQTRASTEAEIVYGVFRNHPHTSFSPWDIYYQLGQQIRKENIARAITTLTPEYLVKTNEKKRNGLYGKTNYTWKLKR